MKSLSLVMLIATVACNNSTNPASKKDTVFIRDTVVIHDTVLQERRPSFRTDTTPKVFSNQRFKDVTIQKVARNKFLIKGKGQIFEAAFGWVIEDGHSELKKGFEMTDAGAPEWGKFSFEVVAPKKATNSSLHIILFETSANDGSRVHQLPILLPE